MKIDETGREIVSMKIDNLFRARICLLANCRNFPFCHDNLEAIANSVGKNQTRIGEYHSCVNAQRRADQMFKHSHSRRPWPFRN